MLAMVKKDLFTGDLFAITGYQHMPGICRFIYLKRVAYNQCLYTAFQKGPLAKIQINTYYKLN